MDKFSDFTKFKNNIDLIYGDFETMNLYNLQNIDLIFINFEELFKDKDCTKFSPRMKNIIKKSLTLTKNITILFPKTLKVSCLAQLFAEELEIYKEWLHFPFLITFYFFLI